MLLDHPMAPPSGECSIRVNSAVSDLAQGDTLAPSGLDGFWWWRMGGFAAGASRAGTLDQCDLPRCSRSRLSSR